MSSRNEQLLEALLNGETPNIVPQSRMEALLLALCQNGTGGGGGATDAQVAAAVAAYLAENPVEGGGSETWDILLNESTDEDIAFFSATTAPAGHTFDEYTEICAIVFAAANANYTSGIKMALNSKNPWGGHFMFPIVGITSGTGQMGLLWLERTSFGWISKGWYKSANTGSMNNSISPGTSASFGNGWANATFNANTVPEDITTFLPNYPVSAIGVGGYQSVLGAGSKVIVYGKRTA